MLKTFILSAFLILSSFLGAIEVAPQELAYVERLSQTIDLLKEKQDQVWPGYDISLTPSANLPVFVLSLKNQTPSEDDRQHINREIKEIQTLYHHAFGDPCPPIDIVGHSLGGGMALYSSFTPCCSVIECGNLKFIENPKSNPSIGRIITLGMPTSSNEMAWILAAGKKNDIYNVVARYDAIINKESVLMHKQLFEIDVGHLGLLGMATYIQVMYWLMLER